MKTIVSMDSAGRLVLPKSVRRTLNSPTPAVFEVEVLGNRVELTLAQSASNPLRRKGKLLVVSKQGVGVDAVKAIEATRADRL